MKVLITNKYTRELNNILLGENFPLFEMVVSSKEEMKTTLENLCLDFTKNFNSYIDTNNNGIKILDLKIAYSTLLKQYKYFDYINQLKKWSDAFIETFSNACFNYSWVDYKVEKLQNEKGNEFEIFFILDNGKEMAWKTPSALNFRKY